MAKERADVLLVQQGLAPNRSKARAFILAGNVVDSKDERIGKAGDLCAAGESLRLTTRPCPFVSRGGLKLSAALKKFQIDVRGHNCLDVGASTGGFTDCLLQAGATRVYGVDVGHNQLDWSLRKDPRVVVLERQNIRHLNPEVIAEPCTRIVIDVSFISLRIVLPAALKFATGTTMLVALVKPQFEVGRQAIGKGGIVRDEKARHEALLAMVSVAERHGVTGIETMDSPIQGTKGNYEYLLGGCFIAPPQ